METHFRQFCAVTPLICSNILAIFLLLGIAITTASAQSGSVVISQIYGGGGNKGATLDRDFIELFDRSSAAVNLSGWTLQYASSTGVTWVRTILSGTIQPGQYFLIGEHTGAAGVSLPVTDVTAAINLDQNSAKIALVSNSADLSGSAPTSAALVDFVGYGSANAAEGQPAPVIDSSTAILRRSNGCAETNNNAADFQIGSPSPRNTASARNLCSGASFVPPPSITAGGITNAATFLSGPLAPGEIVTIFGAGMGPTTLQTMQLDPTGTFASTLLGGTEVLFNGIASPLVYVSATQLCAIVPNGTANAATVDVQVEFNNLTSNKVTMPVASESPGIFTANQSGSGEGAILNQDYSINSSTQPAAAGSVIVIYATGAGLTTPLASDGTVIGSSLPMVQQPVTVHIDGLNADVLYAGMAPHLVNGVLQINALVPTGTRSGLIPLEVWVGGKEAQPSISVNVRTP